MSFSDNSAVPPVRAIMVHGADDARLALSVAIEIDAPAVLVSSPGAAAHGGANWFLQTVAVARAEFPDARATVIVDCDDRAGDAQGALAVGAEAILFTGSDAVAERLADIARSKGARVVTERPPAFDPRGHRDPRTLVRAWLLGMALPDI